MKGFDLESVVVVDRCDDQPDGVTMLHSDDCGIVFILFGCNPDFLRIPTPAGPGVHILREVCPRRLCMSVTAMRTGTATTAALRPGAPTHSRYLEAGCDRPVGNNAARTTTRRFWGKSVRYFHSAQDAAKMSRKRNNQDSNERECPVPKA